MAGKPIPATITSLGPNGTYVGQTDERRVIHLRARRAAANLKVGDRVLCEGIVFCEGDAIAAKYHVVKGAAAAEVRQ